MRTLAQASEVLRDDGRIQTNRSRDLKLRSRPLRPPRIDTTRVSPSVRLRIRRELSRTLSRRPILIILRQAQDDCSPDAKTRRDLSMIPHFVRSSPSVWKCPARNGTSDGIGLLGVLEAAP